MFQDNQKYRINAALQVPRVEARSARGKLLKTTPASMSRLKLEGRAEYSRGDVYKCFIPTPVLCNVILILE